MFFLDEYLVIVVFLDLVGLVGDFFEWDRMDEIVNEDILGWFGFGGGWFIVKFDVIVLFFNVR